MPQLRNQLVAVIDSRTTMVCLAAAGQIQPEGEPFHTLMGDFWQPPFHVHCRTMMQPWMSGFVNEQRSEANAELRRRPLKRRERELARMPPRPARGLPAVRGGMGDTGVDRVVQSWVDELGDRPLSRVPMEFRARVVIHSPRFQCKPVGVFAGKVERYDVTDTVSGRKWVMQLENADDAKVEHLKYGITLDDDLPEPRVLVCGDAEDSMRTWVMHQDVRDWDPDGDIVFSVERWNRAADRAQADPLRLVVSDYVNGTSYRSNATIGVVHDRLGTRLVPLGHVDSRHVDFDGSLYDFLDEAEDHARLMKMVEDVPAGDREAVLDAYDQMRRSMLYDLDSRMRQAKQAARAEFDDIERYDEIADRMRARIESLPTTRELRARLGWNRQLSGVDMPTRVPGELRPLVANDTKELTRMDDLGDELVSGAHLKRETSERITRRLRAADDADDTFADLGGGLARGMEDRYRHIDTYHQAGDVGDWRLLHHGDNSTGAWVWGDNLTERQMREILQNEIEDRGKIIVAKKVGSHGIAPSTSQFDSVDDALEHIRKGIARSDADTYMDDLYEVQIHGSNRVLQQYATLGDSDLGYVHVAVDGHRTVEALQEEIVSRWIRMWATTSGDSSPYSLAVQEMARVEFGLGNSAHPIMTYASRMTKSLLQRTRKDVDELVERSGPALRRFLRAQYDETQEQLERMGIDALGVVRGVSDVPLEVGRHQLRLNPISSFATRAGSADRFSDGTTIWAVVPRERVLGFPGRGYGCRHEDEVVVLGGARGHYDFGWVNRVERV